MSVLSAPDFWVGGPLSRQIGIRCWRQQSELEFYWSPRQPQPMA